MDISAWPDTSEVTKMSPRGGTISVLNRGYAELKIENGPTAAVIITAIIAVPALIVGLALAGWHSESIVGLAVGFSGVFGSLIITLRKQSTLEAKTDQQTHTINAIADQVINK
jgi:hypothetical protein